MYSFLSKVAVIVGCKETSTLLLLVGEGEAKIFLKIKALNTGLPFGSVISSLGLDPEAISRPVGRDLCTKMLITGLLMAQKYWKSPKQ